MKIGDKLICKVIHHKLTRGRIYKVNYIDELTRSKFNVIDDFGDVFVLSIDGCCNYSKYFFTLEEFIDANNREREIKRIIDHIY